MRKASINLGEIIETITKMKGEKVNMEVNKGRKKIEKYIAVIEMVYPSVFTVNIEEPENKGKQSYSFNDVLCGDVIIKGSKVIKKGEVKELAEK